MAFFDEVGKVISQAGQTAVQKTKDMTDLARLHGNISEEEKKINNSYVQIGKLYYAIHQNDCDSDFGNIIAAIRESEKKITEYRQQIHDIKGIVRCEKCGAESPNTALFCCSCGASLPKNATVVNEDVVLCKRCGNMTAKEARFCTSCGNPMSVVVEEEKTASVEETEIPATEAVVEEAEIPATEAVVEEAEIPATEAVVEEAEIPATEPVIEAEIPVTQPVIQAPVQRTCANCGASAEDDALFCTECGKRL